VGSASDDAIAPTIAGTSTGGGSGLASTAADIAAETIEHRYAVGALLGRGGMGEVRAARDRRIGREVAIKSLITGGHEASAEAVARFLREARVQGRLDHPAIVPVHDLGLDERGVPYFAMKRLSGVTLAEIISRQAAGDADALVRWPQRTLLARLAEACLAVELAHTRGVVHRDLKPHNVMLGDFGEVYVLDWGIARIAELGDDDVASARGIERGDIATLDSRPEGTAAGAVLGTIGYMPPEQARGAPIDHRVDVYGMGCILFEILALEPLHVRGTPLPAILDAGPGRPAARRPDRAIAPELDDACARATAPDPAERFATMRELYDAIQHYLDGDRDVARRRELADEHATTATTLLAAGDRAGAMRDAGRALALDPAHAGAADLVGRLLLEPPRETPPEVKTSIAKARAHNATRHLKIAGLAYLTYLGLVPVGLWAGVGDWAMLLALVTVAMLQASFTFVLSWRNRPIGKLAYVALTGDVVLIALFSTLFSPLLIVPGLAAVTGMLYLAAPHRNAAVPVVVFAVVAMLLPLLLEYAGILPRTFWLGSDGLVIRSWLLALDPVVTLLLIVGVNLVLLALAAQMLIHIRRGQDEAEERIHLTAWHLRQLVPDRDSGGVRR
jgi:eukaryotic-like serine/threonine-protein kinase